MSNTIKTYFVRLTPLSTFFFGSEQGETADYYVKGSSFPQQTALLGLMRHQLLLQNKLLTGHKIAGKEKAARLIGPESFRYDGTTGFGVIEQISPCCIIDGVYNKYWPVPPVFTHTVYKHGSNMIFLNYDPKKDYPLQWGAENGKPLYDNTIFTEAERPGIDKPYKENIEEKSYYKQVWLNMRKGFGFGFFITINTTVYNESVTLASALVTFGKEGSVFEMDVKEAIPQFPSHQPGANALLLLSDTFSNSSLPDKCALAFSDNVPFRNLINKTAQQEKDYYNKRPADTNTVRLQLLKKGSVFFAGGQLEELCQEIDIQAQFRVTGYNHYQKIKINTQP